MAREFLERGLGFIPHVMGQPYPDYPPLYFWLVVFFSKIGGGISTVSAVLPSSISAGALIALTFLLGAQDSWRTGLVSCLLLGTFPDFWVHASKTSIDMLLALEVTTSLLLLLRVQSSKNIFRKWMAVLGAALAFFAALLTKGPVGVVLIGTVWGCYSIMDKKFREFGIFAVCFSLVLVICIGLYLAAVWFEGGMSLVNQVVHSQVLSRMKGEANKSVFYYEKYILIASAPWWLWIVGFFVQRRKSKNCSSKTNTGSEASILGKQGRKLAVIWFGVVFIIFSIASTRHGRYLLPGFPALAIIMSYFVERVIDIGKWGKISNITSKAISILFFLIVAGACVCYFFVDISGKVNFLWVMAWAGVVICLWMLKERLIPISHSIFVRQLVCMVAILSGTTLLAFPVISQRESGRNFVEKIESSTPPGMPTVLFKIKKDGDGVKYALYSKHPSSTLKFAFSRNDLAFWSKPCVLVAYQRDLPELRELNGQWEMKTLAKGLIHHKEVVAFLLEDKVL